MAHRADADIIATTHNTARFFTENRQISWVALLLVIAWGIYGYGKMPKRKDPDIPVKEAQVICAWPGVSADRVEQLVTRKIEEKLAEVSEVRAPSAEEYSIKSLTLDGLSVVNVQIDDRFAGLLVVDHGADRYAYDEIGTGCAVLIFVAAVFAAIGVVVALVFEIEQR